MTSTDGRATVDQHLERTLAQVTPLQPIELGLGESLGLVLAEDVAADEPLPAVDTASTAGYAVHAGSLDAATGDAPTLLEVITGDQLGDGAAIRVAGGAPVPDGADTVVPPASVEVRGRRIAVHEPVPTGMNIRRAGRDLTAGQAAVRSGRRIRPGDIAVLAALGRRRLLCHPLPRVVVLVAGDELMGVDGPDGAGSVRDLNGPMLNAMLRQAGTVTFRTGVVAEDRRSLIDAFDSNLGHADVFVTVGGGAGVIEQVLQMLGDVSATEVAMTPGVHQLFGTVRGVPVFGMPGHPAAVFVSFEVLVRPALRRMQGRTDIHRPRIRARLDREVATPHGVRTYLRVGLRRGSSGWDAVVAADQDPHGLASLAAADGLAEVPEDVTTLPAGSEVDVLLLIES